ncbi:hypothetical protein [Porphyromonas gulae]|nr:hypothetical protein [Porphyromonas gulae]
MIEKETRLIRSSLEIPTLYPQPVNSPFHSESRSIPLLAVHK